MQLYELTYLISPELKEGDAEKVLSKIESLLQKEEGVLIDNKKQGTVKLGYEIKNQKRAHLAVLKFQMSPEKRKSFQEKIKEIPEILRFLTLTLEPVGVKKEIPKDVKKPAKLAKVPKEKKVELKEIEKKIEEILGE